MKSYKQYIKEGIEADLIGLLKTFGAGDIEFDEETLSTRLRHKQQVWDIIARLPAWTDYDVFVYEINPATAGKHLENPAGTDNAAIPFDHEGESEADNTYTDDEIGYEDLTDQFHEYELVVYLYNTESEMVEEAYDKDKKKKEKKKKDDIEAAESDQGQDTSTAGTDAEYESAEHDGEMISEAISDDHWVIGNRNGSFWSQKSKIIKIVRASKNAPDLDKYPDANNAIRVGDLKKKLSGMKNTDALMKQLSEDVLIETAGTDAEYESFDWSETDIGPLSEFWDLKAAEKAGLAYKAGSKTVKMVHKTSGKEIVIVQSAKDKYEKLGFELQESTLQERRRIVKVNARGQRRIKIKCKPGYKFANGKCIKITGSEKTKKRRSIKKAVRTKRQKGAGFQRRVQRLRKRAMKKRKSMGLNSGFDIQAKQPKTHGLKQSHEPEGTSLAEGRTYKNNAKIDTKKTEVVYKVPSKDGKSTFVTVHVPQKKAGQDEYEMYTVDKGYNVILSHGTHPSLEGSKKFAKARGLAEEVEQVDEAKYPRGKYGAKARGNAKAQWMRTYEQELSNRKDYEGNAGKIDWNVATHNFFMGVDAKTAAETVKSPYKN